MAQLALFDKSQGEILRDLGLESVEIHNEDFVRSGRNILDKLIEINGKASMDDVRDVFAALDIKPNHCNAYGAIPKSKKYICIDRVVSRYPSRHAGEQRVWTHRERQEAIACA
jgi:ribosomal protein L17